MPTVYAILSGKGGVGKTTITANLGIGLASLGKKTLVVDGDLAAGNLAVHFGLGRLEKTLHDLLSGERKIERAIYKTPQGVDVLPSGLSLKGFLGSDVNLLPRVIKKMADEYDVVLIDTPPGISRNTLVPTKASDKILLVTTPDKPSVSATLKTKAIASLFGRGVVGTLLNRHKKSSFYGWKTEELEQELGIKILGVIPEDENVGRSIDLGKPVVIAKPKAPASKALWGISSGLLAGEPKPEAPAEEKPEAETKPPSRKPRRFPRRGS